MKKSLLFIIFLSISMFIYADIIYVNGLVNDNILGNTERENELLETLESKGFDELRCYEIDNNSNISLVEYLSQRQENRETFSAFLTKAKNDYGFISTGVVASSYFILHQNLNYNILNRISELNEMAEELLVDAVVTEIEFWNSDNPMTAFEDKYVPSIEALTDYRESLILEWAENFKIETYITATKNLGIDASWETFENTLINENGNIDRIFLCCYENDFRYSTGLIERIDIIYEAFYDDIEIVPLLSLEVNYLDRIYYNNLIDDPDVILDSQKELFNYNISQFSSIQDDTILNILENINYVFFTSSKLMDIIENEETNYVFEGELSFESGFNPSEINIKLYKSGESEPFRKIYTSHNDDIEFIFDDVSYFNIENKHFQTLLRIEDFSNYEIEISFEAPNDVSKTLRLENIKVSELTYPINLGTILYFDESEITQNTTWDSNVYIGSNITVNESVILTIAENGTVNFAEKNYDLEENQDLFVNGILKVLNGGTINLSNHSAIFVGSDNNSESNIAELNLDYGATITGRNGKKRNIYMNGDRIIVQDFGKIRAGSEYILPDNQPTINFTKFDENSENWLGVIIENNDEATYEFKNCNFSGCGISMIQENHNGSLDIEKTTFSNSSGVYVSNINFLNIHNNTTFNNSYSQLGAITSYNSVVNIDAVNILNSLRDGIYLANLSGENESIIQNCDIFDNGGNGINLSNNYINVLSENNIYENEFNGIYTSTGSSISDLTTNEIYDNDLVEFRGSTESIRNITGDNNHIYDNANDGVLEDFYLIWVDDFTGNPIDLSGNTLHYENTSTNLIDHLEPEEAFIGIGYLSISQQILEEALTQIRLKEYDTAITKLKEVIENYPETIEAATALRFLYFVEASTTKDYQDVRDYISFIQSEGFPKLEETKEDIIIQIYIQEKEYLVAIELLEDKISNTQNPDEELSAMLDQAYCELMVFYQGLRAEFSQYTMQVRSELDYQNAIDCAYKKYDNAKEQSNNSTNTISNIISQAGNYPNPFNPQTTIKFNLLEKANVNLSIYNVKGQKVKTLANENLSQGQHQFIWKGNSNSGNPVSSGIYFYQIQTNKSTKTGKLLLMK